MNSIFWFLARRAGFAFWEKEDSVPWRKPSDGGSCMYDKEIQKYTKLVVEHTVDYITRNGLAKKEDILVDFGFERMLREEALDKMVEESERLGLYD